MKQYNDLLQEVVNKGKSRKDRTNTGTVSVFGRQIRFDLNEGFPLYTRRFIPFKPNVAELKWYLNGCTNALALKDMGSGVWEKWMLGSDVESYTRLPLLERLKRIADEKGMTIAKYIKLIPQHVVDNGTIGSWLDENGLGYAVEKYAFGELGPVYGKQWRDFNGVDQIKELLHGLINNPFSRRHIVSAWNPEVLPNESDSHANNILKGKAVLPPCHTLFQCYVEEIDLNEQIEVFNKKHSWTSGITLSHPGDNAPKMRLGMIADIIGSYKVPKRRLSLHLYMRSCDLPVGLPFNICCYALLTHLLANTCGYGVGELVISFGDAHIYSNQMEYVEKLLTVGDLPLPLLKLREGVNVFNFDIDDVTNSLQGYEHRGVMKIPVTV